MLRHASPRGCRAVRRLAAGHRDDALGDLALEHQRHGEVERRPRDGQPADQELGADIVGQVCDDPGRLAGRNRGEIGLQRIAGDDLQPTRIVRADLRKRRQAAFVTFDGDDSVAPSASSARVRPPGPGPTSMVVTPARPPAVRAILPVRLRSRRKFWPSAFLAAMPWRWMTSRSGGSPSPSCRDQPDSGQPPGKLQRSDQAVGPRSTRAGNVEGRSVVGRRADERQAERDVHGLVESQRLCRYQRLIVVHADRRVVGRARLRWNIVSAASGPNASTPSAQSLATAGATISIVLAADRAAFAGMRIETGHRKPGSRNAEPVAKAVGNDPPGRRRSAPSKAPRVPG